MKNKMGWALAGANLLFGVWGMTNFLGTARPWMAAFNFFVAGLCAGVAFLG